jgi:hypothetical protein
VSDPVIYTAVLPAPDKTVLFVSGLLAAERRRRGTRRGRRALGCYRQAVLLLRWFLDGTRLAQLAIDNAISTSTAYRYLHEGIDALAGVAPGLRGALLAARAAGHAHVQVDGTLIRTDRCSVPGPTARRGREGARVDLWWSGKHAAHGGNVQIVTAPDGWPIWTSGVRPGREHDTTCLRAHPDLLPLLAEWTDADHAALGDHGPRAAAAPRRGRRHRRVRPAWSPRSAAASCRSGRHSGGLSRRRRSLRPASPGPPRPAPRPPRARSRRPVPAG